MNPQPDPLTELPQTVQSSRHQLDRLSQQVDKLPEPHRAPIRALLDDLAATQDRLAQATQMLISLRLISENATDMISRHALDGTFLYVSPICRAITGYTPEELVGRNGYDFIHPDDIPALRQSQIAIMSAPDPLIAQYRLRHKNGHYIWAEATHRAVRDPETGDVYEFLAMTRDITARKQAENALRKQQELYHQLLVTSPDAIIVTDATATITFASVQACSVLGVKRPEDLIGVHAYDIVAPEDHERVTASIQSIRQGRLTRGSQYTLLRHDGSRFIGEVNSTPLFDADGHVTGAMVILRDITEQQLMLDALLESEERFRAVFETAQDAIFIKDCSRVYTHVNPTFCRYNGKPAAEIIGKTDRDLSGEEIDAEIDAVDQRVLAGEATDHEQTRVLNGVVHTLHILKMPLRDSTGQVIGICGISRDITERKRVEEALRRSETMLRETQAMAQVGGWELDVQTHQLIWTPETYHIHEIPPGTVLSLEDGLNFYIPEHRPILQNAILRVLETGEPFDLELQLVTASGRLRWVRVLGKAHYDGDVIVKISGTGQDITDRKQAELALRDSEARLRSIVRASPIGIGVVVNRVIVQANDHLCTMTGYRRDELLNQSARLLYASNEDYDYVGREKYAQIAASGTGTVETRWRRKNGSLIDVLLSSTPLDPADLTAGVTFTALDITKRKRTEAALRESELRYRTVADFTYDMEYWVSQDDELRYVSPACFRVTGYTREQFMADPDLRHTMVLPDDQPIWQEHTQQPLTSPGQQHLEFRIRRADGAIRWIEHICRPVTDDQGHYLGFRASNRDITDRRQVQDALRDSEARYRILVDNFPNGIVALFDHDLRVILAGGQGLAKVSPTAEQLVGQYLPDIFPPEFFARDEPAWRAALLGETTVSDMAFVTRQYRVHTLPVRDTGGNVVAGMIMAQDVTDQLQAEQRRLELLVERERVKVLTDFIQNASHEFSSPLSVINTSLYLLSRSYESSSQKGQIDILKQQTQQIDSLVKAMLAMSRLDSGITMHFAPTDINQLLRDIQIRLQPAIDKKRLAFALNLDKTFPLVTGDQRELYQALLNLFDNAVQFTPEGGAIRVSTTARPTQTVIRIQDTGIGIGEQDLPHIFERFYRADKARTTRGAGLGLPVAKKIIEQHGGMILVDSSLGQGTIVTVILPHQPVSTARGIHPAESGADPAVQSQDRL